MTEKPLSELCSDQEAEVVGIHGGWVMQARLQELGIVAGQKIKKLSRVGVNGPIIVLINRAQIAIGAGMASRIVVKVNSHA